MNHEQVSGKESTASVGTGRASLHIGPNLEALCVYYMTTECKSSLFPTSSPIFVFCLFDNSHLNSFEVIFHYGFDFHFHDG